MNLTIRYALTRVVKTSWVIVLTLLCSSNITAAEYQYSYPITGSTVDELVNQIRANSESPSGAFGYTKLTTDLSWKSSESQDGVCSIESANFSYDITIYMPEWIDSHNAKQCLQNNWAAVWNEVQLHEEEHRRIFRLLDQDKINQRINAIQPQTSCENLKANVQAEMQKIFDANNILHERFHAANTPPTLRDC